MGYVGLRGNLKLVDDIILMVWFLGYFYDFREVIIIRRGNCCLIIKIGLVYIFKVRVI